MSFIKQVTSDAEFRAELAKDPKKLVCRGEPSHGMTSNGNPKETLDAGVVPGFSHHVY